jgi:diguanylate cyclase (GGDEF)-like protein
VSMFPPAGIRRCVAPHVAAAVVAAVWMAGKLGGEATAAVFANIAELVAATCAAVACLRTARTAAGSTRHGWALLGAGAGSWAAGQAIWTWLENVAGVEVPFPSVADIGFLALVPLTVAGASMLIVTGRTAARTLLDGLLVTGSMFYLSWIVVLGPLYHARTETAAEWLVTLAYPAGDVITGSMMFILFGRVRRGQRLTLGLLGSGYLLLALADTGFAYLVSNGTYSSNSAYDIGWVWGFLAVSLAAGLARRQPPTSGLDAERLWIALPYVPLAVALAASAVVTVHRGTVGPMLYALSSVLVVLVVARQVVSLRENRDLTRELTALVRELSDSKRRLRRLAYTDTLTGLANRASLFDALDQACADQDSDGVPLALLFIDLDGFKQVNDTHGHETGDALLVAAAHRMQACLGPGDLLARLGGDEFAILARHPDHDTDERLASAVVRTLGRPFDINGHRLRVGGSVGLAWRHPYGGDRRAWLREADQAMYAAKAAGKAGYTVADLAPVLVPAPSPERPTVRQ